MTCILGCIYRSIRTVRMANVGSGPAGVCRRRRSTTRVTTREPTGMFSFVLWELLGHTTDHPQNHLDCLELFLRLFVNFHVLLFITDIVFWSWHRVLTNVVWGSLCSDGRKTCVETRERERQQETGFCGVLWERPVSSSGLQRVDDGDDKHYWKPT